MLPVVLKVLADWKDDVREDLPDQHTLSVPQILTYVYAFAGLVAAGFIVYGGIQYASSGGDPGKAAKAKNTILFSVVGLVIVLVAAAITAFVSQAIK